MTAVTMESLSAEPGLISRVAWPVILKVIWVPNLERMSWPRRGLDLVAPNFTETCLAEGLFSSLCLN
jgi:hypothetical protein